MGHIELKHGKFYEKGKGQQLSKAHVVEAVSQLEEEVEDRDLTIEVLEGQIKHLEQKLDDLDMELREDYERDGA